jgi:hypothetical protein
MYGYFIVPDVGMSGFPVILKRNPMFAPAAIALTGKSRKNKVSLEAAYRTCLETPIVNHRQLCVLQKRGNTMLTRARMADEMARQSERPVVFRELVSDIPITTYATFGLYKYPALRA